MTQFAASTHPGLKRNHNEDCYEANPELGLWLVADGVGGHAHGEVASGIVRDTVRMVILPLWNALSFFTIYANLDGWQPGGPAPEFAARPPLDRWILSRAQATIRGVDEALEAYRFDRAADLPSAEHAAFVERECPDPGPLRDALAADRPVVGLGSSRLTCEDAYLMQYRYRSEKPAMAQPVNRIRRLAASKASFAS